MNVRTNEVRYCELRLGSDSNTEGSDRTIEGTIVRFDDEANIGGVFRERINAGAFEIRSDMVLNAQHDRSKPLAKLNSATFASMSIRQTMEAYTVRARIAKTTIGDDALTNVREGLLTGFSVEMRVQDEDWREDATLRIIKRATMAGIALVDRPAYPQSSVEARQAYLDGQLADFIRRHPRISYYL